MQCVTNTIVFVLTILANVFFFPTVARSQVLPVEIWHNHTYSNTFLTSMKNALQGTGGNSCVPIPTEQSFMFLVDQTVSAGEVPVRIQGEGLECAPRTCLGDSMMVLQTESSCNADGRSLFCGHPERCIPNTYDSNSCTFTCKCEPVPGTSVCNIRIAVHFRLDEIATPSEPSQLCGFNMGTLPPPPPSPPPSIRLPPKWYGYPANQLCSITPCSHCNEFIVSAAASHIKGVSIVCSTVGSHASNISVTGLCAGNSPVTGEFATQKANNAENVSIWWHHHDTDLRLSNESILLA